jgi:magnesium-transporting ATPase (P-type)
MAKKNAIIRALPAVETLGSVTVLMSDKTGTLTKNEMTMVAFVTTDTRWRFDVNASERTTANFWIDDAYMATRADHTKRMKASDVIRSGPSAERRARPNRVKTLSTLSSFSGRTFPFGMTVGFGKTAHGGVEPEEPTPIVAPDGVDDTFATIGGPKGESPDPTYLRQVLAGGILCSKCVLGENGGRVGEIGNPTELSILRAAYYGGVDVTEVKESAAIVAEVPFSSEYKFMATVHEPVEANDTSDYLDELIVHVKGAPDRMIPLCKYQARGGSFAKADLEDCEELFWIEQIAVLSSHGLRVLALTRGTVPRSEVSPGQQLGPEFVLHRGEPWLTIVGLCAIMDPPRPECVHAVKQANAAGVRVGMITGDHRDTALAIGFMLGLVDKQHSEAITGPEMDAMSDDELRVAVQKHNVFARASPQNKIRIVKALQADGEVCAMTGDGTNDAPALKAADMGVAMGKEGTDVAREASEMILVGTLCDRWRW